MKDLLRINTDLYQVDEKEIENRKIRYRAYRDLLYCENPLDEIQKINIFVPEAYYHDEKIGRYDRNNAPVFLPNTVGGYMPGPADEPGIDSHNKKINSLFEALEHGYIAVSAGVRGRTSGKIATEFFEGSKEGKLGKETGRMVGRAPAFIVDYKAAIRFLRHNSDLLPGNYERIITNGTSAGGALSALAGSSGNEKEFEPYLKQIGAADERDDVFASSCYCPIHNLENADSAYEWQFCGLNDYHRTKHQRTETGIIRVPDEGMMSEKQIALSKKLKDLFPAYLNCLELKDEDNTLSLDEEGNGSFKQLVKRYLIASAQKEYDSHSNEKELSYLMNEKAHIDDQEYLKIEEGKIIDLDFERYVNQITRMKQTPAFDDLMMKSPENEEFGDENIDARHFTAFSYENNEAENNEMADPKIISLMNPICHLDHDDHTITKHWRIRHGSFDRDTSLAIPVILATTLKNIGCDVDFALPWGLPHSGDYDLDELFAWIDELCNE